jgi:hypothetical protein
VSVACWDVILSEAVGATALGRYAGIQAVQINFPRSVSVADRLCTLTLSRPVGQLLMRGLTQPTSPSLKNRIRPQCSQRTSSPAFFSCMTTDLVTTM